MIIPALDDKAVITVKRVFPAPRERVFRAWTERKALEQWFKPGGCSVTVNTLDLQVGGFFRFDLADNRDSLVGTYLEIIRPEKLVFTWSSLATRLQETLVSIEFLEYKRLTQIILTHAQLADQAMCSIHQTGWHILLDQLPLVLSATPPPIQSHTYSCAMRTLDRERDRHYT